jgi:hypothetical protein
MSGEPIIIDENQNGIAAAADMEPGEERVNEDGSVIFRLYYPKTFNFRRNNADNIQEITHITLKRPEGADIRKINVVKDDLEKAVAAFTRLTGHPSAVFDKLDAKDIKHIGEVIGGFMGESQ